MNTEKLDLAMPDPWADGRHHINTHAVGRTDLGQYLSPPFQNRGGKTLEHPILGSFRTVESVWHYLNSGGGEKFRFMNLRAARKLVKVVKNYRCSHFKEILIDALVLHLRNNSKYERLIAECDLPFEHYFLSGPDKVPTRPNHAGLYIDAVNEVREIFRGNKQHSFVRYSDMKFEPWSYNPDK
jgi:hypothetical protein